MHQVLFQIVQRLQDELGAWPQYGAAQEEAFISVFFWARAWAISRYCSNPELSAAEICEAYLAERKRRIDSLTESQIASWEKLHAI